MGLSYARPADCGPSSPLLVTVYTDASYGEDRETRRSQTGTASLLSGGLVLWQSKRQITTATSSSEAEYQALASSVKEAI